MVGSALDVPKSLLIEVQVQISPSLDQKKKSPLVAYLKLLFGL